MPDRYQITLLIAAAFSALLLALLSFLVTGLLVDRLPHTEQQGLTTVLLAVPCVVFIGSFGLVFRLTRHWRAQQTRPVKWMFFGFAAATAGFAVGAVLFSIALRYLPRQWFSRGGDWDFDPLIETMAIGLIFCLIGFWWVYGRSRRPQ